MARLALAGLGPGLLAAIVTTNVAHAATWPGQPHDFCIRSEQGAVMALIARGNLGSSTFRSLTGRIASSDGVVHILEGECPDASYACLVGVSPAGPRRMFWVRLTLAGERPDEDVIASIAHELRHVQEVLEVRSIRSTEQMQQYFSRIGFRGSARGYETLAAQRAGAAVRAEMRAYAQLQ